MWANLMEIFTSDGMQSMESDMLPFVSNFKESFKIGLETDFLGNF